MMLANDVEQMGQRTQKTKDGSEEGKSQKGKQQFK